MINTILAIPAYRFVPTGNAVFTFWETPAGTARAMRNWYWPGDNYGQEFPYPKHLREVAVAAPIQAPTAPPVEQPPAPAPAPQAEQSSQAPAPQAETEVEQESEIAQAAPPPPPPAPEAAPVPPEQPQSQSTQPGSNQPQELPKTASPFPLIGLSGLVSFGLYGLLRLRRSV